MILVSHDLSMVYPHASRVYALNGVICCEGPPEQVMNAESLKQAYGIHATPYDTIIRIQGLILNKIEMTM